MAYKCSVCGERDVEHPGDVCDLCALGQDPYAASMAQQVKNSRSRQVYEAPPVQEDTYVPGRGKTRKILVGGSPALQDTDPCGNEIAPQEEVSTETPIYRSGQTPMHTSENSGSVHVSSSSKKSNSSSANISNQPITKGISKNISVDTQKRSALAKWFRTLFTGVPFTFDDNITMFQVFPDFNGQALNAMGNACDQVIVYGKLNAGAVSENNEVEVYGRRDASNNVVAKSIRNVASGTTITPDGAMGPAAVWLITLLVLAVVCGVAGTLGASGMIWIIVLLICLANLPLILKIMAGVIAVIFSFGRRKK